MKTKRALNLFFLFGVQSQFSCPVYGDVIDHINLDKVWDKSEVKFRGNICEALAVELLSSQLDHRHQRLGSNIKYYRGGNRIVGELDVVIYNKAKYGREYISAVIEVKCSNRPQQAMEKAEDQLYRFEHNLQQHCNTVSSNQNLYLEEEKGQRRAPCYNVDNIEWAVAGPRGGGYDIELDSTIDEINEYVAKNHLP